jgi:hypothetical protein
LHCCNNICYFKHYWLIFQNNRIGKANISDTHVNIILVHRELHYEMYIKCCTFIILIYVENTMFTTTCCVTLINLKRENCFYIIVKCTSKRARHAYAKGFLTVLVDLNFKLTRPLLMFTMSSSWLRKWPVLDIRKPGCSVTCTVYLPRIDTFHHYLQKRRNQKNLHIFNMF